jgi:hypothetical protein
MVDVALFSASIYLILKFGKKVGETIENELPTEQKMLEMIQQQSGGMPPMM